jgi:hypothetical protein
MDKIQISSEGLNSNGKVGEVLKQPEQAGGLEVSPIIKSAKERLQTILAKREIDPN